MYIVYYVFFDLIDLNSSLVSFIQTT